MKVRKLYFYSIESSKVNSAYAPFSVLPKTSLEIPRKNPDYEMFLDKLVESYLQKVSVEIIEYPPDNCFRNIIERVINRKKPFLVTGEHKDYGFKDVVIWESILNYKSVDDFSKVIIMTGDDGFDESCITEFKMKHGKYMFIFNNSKEALSELSKDYGMFLEENEYLKFARGEYFKDLLETDIFEKEVIRIGDGEFTIQDYEVKEQCKDLEKIADENDDKNDLYMITSLVIVYYNDGSSDKDIEVTSRTYIDDIKDLQLLEYEPELI
ncbi:MAG: PIN domain-containing protein [Methanosarcina barkeri]|nr:PIN domain-containing protein [Methanosarcina sp. ERenArc_MAG2]